MSVRKFRSAEEAAEALLREGRDGDRWRRTAFMLRVAAALHPRRFPTGVRRYRSLAEADADRTAWQRADAPPRRA